MDMNMKVQGSKSGKALGIGELLASASSARTPLDPAIIGIITYHMIAKSQSRSHKVATDHKIMPGS